MHIWIFEMEATLLYENSHIELCDGYLISVIQYKTVAELLSFVFLLFTGDLIVSITLWEPCFQFFKVYAFHGHLMTDLALLGTLHQSLSR